MLPQSLKFKLNNGIHLPAVGLGTSQASKVWPGTKEEQALEDSIFQAIEIGYRHIDTALIYETEVNVGNAIRRSSIPRSELFITSKLYETYHGRVVEGFELSLKNLGLEYIDLYLMHWPQPLTEDGKPTDNPSSVETWLQMEKLLGTGKCRAIGVSNFSVKTLQPLLLHANVIPAVNQIEIHPYLPQFEMVKFCEENGIHVTSWASLGPQGSKHKINIHDDPLITSVASKNNISNTQVVLSWIVQRGISVIPKSNNVARLTANLDLIELPDEDIKIMNELHMMEERSYRIGGEISRSADGEITIAGWTYSQLGWE